MRVGGTACFDSRDLGHGADERLMFARGAVRGQRHSEAQQLQRHPPRNAVSHSPEVVGRQAPQGAPRSRHSCCRRRVRRCMVHRLDGCRALGAAVGVCQEAHVSHDCCSTKAPQGREPPFRQADEAGSWGMWATRQHAQAASKIRGIERLAPGACLSACTSPAYACHSWRMVVRCAAVGAMAAATASHCPGGAFAAVANSPCTTSGRSRRARPMTTLCRGGGGTASVVPQLDAAG